MTKEVETLSDAEDLLLTSAQKSETLLCLYDKVSESVSQKEIKSNVHFKLLVPAVAAGAIIGKGGEAITEIQNKTSTKVKMSKANDFYPGTTERVCLIIGTVESILLVFRYISEKIYEKPETILRSTSKGGRTPTERHKQVKILVPNSTAGIIIGKGGSFIKEVKDTSGVFIQVSQRSKELNLAERCVTIAGEMSQTYEAVVQLLVKIASDPQSSSCPNISYAEVPRPVASAYPTGSPYAFVMGPGFTIDSSNLMPPSDNSEAANHNHLMSPGGLPPLADIIVNTSSTPQPPTPHLPPFGPMSPVDRQAVNSPGQVYGSHNFAAAAMAAIGVVASTNSRRHYNSRTAVGRALTGRGSSSSAGHQQQHQQSHLSYGLLGADSTNSLASSAPPPVYGLSTSSGLGSGSACATGGGGVVGLETVKHVLRSAGYTDAATEEIANAMHVLSVYGFISMSSLFGSGVGPNTMSTSVNNNNINHFSTTSSPRSGYLSTGPQSPSGFTSVFSSAGGGGDGSSSFRSSLTPFQSHPFRAPHFTSPFSSSKPMSFANSNNNRLAYLPSTSSITPLNTELTLHDNLSVSTSTLPNHCDLAAEAAAPLVLASPLATTGLYTTLSSSDHQHHQLLSMHNQTTSSSSPSSSMTAHLPLSDTAACLLPLTQALLAGLPTDSSSVSSCCPLATTAPVNGASISSREAASLSGGSERDASPPNASASTRTAVELWSAAVSTVFPVGLQPSA